uniref:FUN14 domain-containing protein 2 n=1 Tax=Amazona collaria TaxID=241587 RepID=A0A8B9EZQ4_9PSIT
MATRSAGAEDSFNVLVGKLAATALGGGFFLLQISNHAGYIKVDWKLVERDMDKAKQQLKFHSSGNKMSPEVKSRVDEMIIFLNIAEVTVSRGDACSA